MAEMNLDNNTRVEVFKETDDDWYPNYHKRLVKVIFHRQLTDGKFRTSVWGADDTGMCKDYDTREEAYANFELIIAQQAVNKEWLQTQLGFEYF